MNSPKKQTSPVRRITIDERLTEGLIRILVAELKAGRETFGDDPEYWGEEEELLVGPENYQDNMGMTQADVEKWPWKDLAEGQVFLQGGFPEIPEEGAEPPFVVDAEQRNFQRIDRLSKEGVKRKYLAALERGISDVEPKRTK